MIKRFSIFRLPVLRCGCCLAHDLPHDPSGLLEKGRAEENIYFRKKEYEELERMRRKLERLERTQQQLEDKLEKAREVIEELKEAKEPKNVNNPVNTK